MPPFYLLGPLICSTLLVLPVQSFAAPKPSASKAPVESATPSNKLLSDHWYTITVRGLRYGFYNDRVELRGGRLYRQNHVWKKEEGYLNEEQLGAYAVNNDELTPLFFNFHSTYRSSEIAVDGTVQDGKLTVKARRGRAELPVVRKTISPKTIFEIFFPAWLARKAPTLKPGQSASFLAILEDSIELGFTPVVGRVHAVKGAERKYLVNLHDQDSTWWLDAAGVPVKFEIPSQGTVVKLVSAEEAKKFLE